MKRHPRSPASLTRAGVTLTEVLVAMFVMALGMISILTLFPLGAMQVGQALKDDRCSQAALQADGYVRSYWRHQVADTLSPSPSGFSLEAFYHGMDEPNLFALSNQTPKTAPTVSGRQVYGNAFLPTTLQLPSGAGLPKTTPAGGPVSNSMLTGDTVPNPAVNPATTTAGGVTYTYADRQPMPSGRVSYPVLIDPLGWTSRPSNLGKVWAAAQSFSAVPSFLLMPRRTFNQVADNAQTAFQVASMSDDLTFQMNGAPDGSALARQGRYTWAAVVQRPKNEVRGVASLTVMVFDGRSTLPGMTDEVAVAADAAANVGDRSLTVTLPIRTSNDPVLLRRGGWVLHAPMDGYTPATFYRVSGFVEGASSATQTQYAVDLEAPLKYAVGTGAANTNLYFFAGLSEVFPRPQLRPDVGY